MPFSCHPGAGWLELIRVLQTLVALSAFHSFWLCWCIGKMTKYLPRSWYIKTVRSLQNSVSKGQYHEVHLFLSFFDWPIPVIGHAPSTSFRCNPRSSPFPQERYESLYPALLSYSLHLPWGSQLLRLKFQGIKWVWNSGLLLILF